MLNSFLPCLVVGCVLGILSGLGIGGGSLLMLWLTVVLDMQPEQARLLNLMFFIPCALSASVFHLRQSRLPLRQTAAAIAAGLAGALLTGLWRDKMDTQLLKKALGVLFLLCALRELTYRPREFK